MALLSLFGSWSRSRRGCRESDVLLPRGRQLQVHPTTGSARISGHNFAGTVGPIGSYAAAGMVLYRRLVFHNQQKLSESEGAEIHLLGYGREKQIFRIARH
jgi:hypothetical protein